MSRLLPILRTIGDCTCVGTRKPGAEPPELDANAALAFAWAGLLFGALVAGLAYPLSVALLPTEVALAGALCFQAFLLNFQAEASLVEAASRNRARAAGVVVLFILLKLSIYRTFFPEEMSALLLLGTAVQAAAPALTMEFDRKRAGHLPLAFLPVFLAAVCICLWFPWVPHFSDGSEILRHLIPVVLVSAGLLLARLFILAWMRERGVARHPQIAFAGALPCEIAVIGGYLFARYHNL